MLRGSFTIWMRSHLLPRLLEFLNPLNSRFDDIIVESMSSPLDRRTFLQSAITGAAALSTARQATAADDSEQRTVHSEVDKHHDEAVHRLQEWIRQPSI